MKFLRTIHFDQSDEHVFDVACPSDELTVSGAFAFAHFDEADVKGKIKQAFANGFLGVPSFGRSTFSSVADVDEAEIAHLQDQLAQHFVDFYGAPDVEAARGAAIDETNFIVELCADALINTVFTVRRQFDETGEIREEFRTITPPTDKPLHSRIWNVVEDDVAEGQ